MQIIPMSNTGEESSQYLSDVEASEAANLHNGYNYSGTLWKEGDEGDGPFTQDNPPPGMVFDSYLKGCIGVNWKAFVGVTETDTACDEVWHQASLISTVEGEAGRSEQVTPPSHMSLHVTDPDPHPNSNLDPDSAPDPDASQVVLESAVSTDTLLLSVHRSADSIVSQASWDTLQVGEGEHARFGNKALKLNHARDPNTRVAIAYSGTDTAIDTGGPLRAERVDVVSTRAIAAGEALSFNYNTTEWAMAEPFTDWGNHHSHHSPQTITVPSNQDLSPPLTPQYTPTNRPHPPRLPIIPPPTSSFAAPRHTLVPATREEVGGFSLASEEEQAWLLASGMVAPHISMRARTQAQAQGQNKNA